MPEMTERVREVMTAVHNMHVLATVGADGKPHMRWMGALVEHPEQPWTFFLVCNKESRKMAQIAANNQAQLLFTNQDKWEIASLSGTVEAADCPECRKMMWDSVPAMSRYYSGPDDPKMAIILFKTECLELLAMSEGHQVYCLEL